MLRATPTASADEVPPHMRRPKDDLPPPPELPSFTVEKDADEPEDVSLRHDGTGLVRHDVPLNDHLIDADAAKVVRRLERAGFQAYLVGGCVRDLLLGQKPKDFDIATDARPEDVRQQFRNCRIIGRRFRLAHVLFGHGKVIEVATFRKNPIAEGQEDEQNLNSDLLIRNDNVFGEAHEDALRRDFTINALFYDIDRRQVLDWCGGMEHIEHRVIHTIGDPNVRFREDPVRILRAIKFAARRDLGISPAVYDAMVAHREALGHAARPRLFEEILRLLRGGAAHRSMWLLWETGGMAQLIPELAAYLDDDVGGTAVDRFFKKMDAIDRRVREGGEPPGDVVLFTTLLRDPMEEACEGMRDKVEAAYEFLDPITERIAIPRRISDAMRRIITMQSRLLTGKLGRLARAEHADLALEVLEIELEAKGMSSAIVEEMRTQLPPPGEGTDEEGPAPRRPKRRRGGRRR